MFDVLGDRVRSQVTLVFRTLLETHSSDCKFQFKLDNNRLTIQVTDWTESEKLPVD